MSNYTASIEQQNEELKQKLGDAERKRDFYHKRLKKMWSMHIYTRHGKLKSLRIVSDTTIRIPWGCLLAALSQKKLCSFTIWRTYGEDSGYGCHMEKDTTSKKCNLILFRGGNQFDGIFSRITFKSMKDMITEMEKYLRDKRILCDDYA